jgi:type III secretion system low calcium response chaperone LcrH/SycD
MAESENVSIEDIKSNLAEKYGLEEIGDAAKEQLEMMDQIMELLASGGSLKDIRGLSDTDMEVLYSMAHTLYTGGKYEKATAVFRFLCLFDHMNFKWWMGLGASQQMQKQYEEALKAYAYATMLDVMNPKPQFHAGYCLLALEMYEEAAAAFEATIAAANGEDEFKAVEIQAEALLKVAESKMEEAE